MKKSENRTAPVTEIKTMDLTSMKIIEYFHPKNGENHLSRVNSVCLHIFTKNLIYHRPDVYLIKFQHIFSLEFAVF